jgi:hypothetical protein
MVVKAFVFETRGGALLEEVTPIDLDWSETANQAETVTPTFDLTSVTEGRRGWRNLGAAWKHSIAIDVGGRYLGGPIMPHYFDGDKGRLRITARGGRQLFTRRSILPLAAMPPRSFTLPDGTPDTSLDTTFAGFDLGTIAKKIGQQACTWPGADDLPIVWPEDRAGSHEQTYPAVDRKKVEAAWTDLSKRENGPDLRLSLERNGSGFQWRFASGTEEKPRLEGAEAFAWDLGNGSSISVQTNPTLMGSLAWSQSGRVADTTLVRALYDPLLVDHGYPLLEVETDASSSITEAETLDSLNVEAMRTAGKPWEFWSFKVPTNREPYPFEYGPGSLIEVIVTESTEVRGRYIAPGRYTRRIAGLSGDLGDWITITCGETYDA